MTAESMEQSLEKFWTGYQPEVETLYMSSEGARSLGLDVSDQPAGTIVVLDKNGVSYMAVDDDA